MDSGLRELRIDSHKLHFHPRRVADWQSAQGDWEAVKNISPIYVEVSPVGACNHACYFCGVDFVLAHNKLGKIPQIEAGRYRALIAEMGGLGVKSVMFAGAGEPLLHREINEFVASTTEAGVDASFTTNGTLLHKLETIALCSWVKVSVNAGSKETYAKVHRTKEKDWDTVWANMESAAKRKGKCTLGVQMVVLPENGDEIIALVSKAHDSGADYVVLKPYSQHKSSINKLETDYSTYPQLRLKWKDTPGFKVVVRSDAINTKDISYDKCRATPYFWAYLDERGDVYSCSAYLLDDRFNLGNINESTFKDVWQGEKRRANWELVSNKLDIHECRVNCRMNRANLYLNELVSGPEHANFI